jgi:hypothetical protein
MTQKPNGIEELISCLQQERDELKLKMHLTGMETKEEYDRLSDKLDELLVQYKPVSNAVEESAKNVVSALVLAADEMKNGFHRVRKNITDQ